MVDRKKEKKNGRKGRKAETQEKCHYLVLQGPPKAHRLMAWCQPAVLLGEDKHLGCGTYWKEI